MPPPSNSSNQGHQEEGNLESEQKWLLGLSKLVSSAPGAEASSHSAITSSPSRMVRIANQTSHHTLCLLLCGCAAEFCGNANQLFSFRPSCSPKASLIPSLYNHGQWKQQTQNSYGHFLKACFRRAELCIRAAFWQSIPSWADECRLSYSPLNNIHLERCR